MAHLNIKKVLLYFIVSLAQGINLHAATASCGNNGTLNVAILDANQPYSDYDPVLNTPYGFDVDLVMALAKILGYKVNFIFVLAQPSAADLNTGVYDLYANSNTMLDILTLISYGGLITDIALITDVAGTPEYRGYLFSQSCCALMSQFEIAITSLVENGTYADLVQKQRQDPRQIGFTANMGRFFSAIAPDAKLVEPLEFNSSLAGTIPQTIGNPMGATGCRSARTGLPQTNCLSQFVIANTLNCFTFTGITDSGPFSGTGCTSF